jgi:hypothetical protein
MRNYLFLISIVFFLCSCGSSKSPEDCKITEGSQWSQLKKNCIKLADSKFTLTPQEAAPGKTGIAYLVFSSDSDKAEALLPGNTSTGVMIRSDDVSPWMNAAGWSLNIGSAYVLKKNNVVMYVE